MKPFYSKSMLIEMNTSEAIVLRILVANKRNELLKLGKIHLDEENKECLEARIEFFDQMYKDLTAIVQSMPFEMD